MSGWGRGYVTDVTYTFGWYRQQSPSIMALAALLGGVIAAVPGPDDPVHYLELGSGQGFGAMLLASSNPSWRVTAIDFNPAHIGAAREWAAEAGLTNITFLEGDFATLETDAAWRALPEVDFASLHGIWSWVPKPSQDGIVRLLRDKVRPGGVVHVSYNALPGWGGALGMARLLRTAGRQLARRSDRQAEEGLKLVRDLFNAEAVQLRRSPLVKSVIDRLDVLPTSYLAHEYMNEYWAPCYHADVVAALADAKLEWVGVASLVENFPDLTLTAEQRAIIQKFDDPLMRELIKDHCVERVLRHDVFVRGARRIGPAARDAVLRDTWLNLNITPADMPREVEMPAGQAQLNPGFYQPIAAALAGGPKRVGDLLQLPLLEGKRDNPAELVGMMIGMELSDPVIRPDAEPAPQALRFNRMTARRLLRSEPLARPLAAASYRVGMPVGCTLLDLVMLDRTLDGEGDIDSLISFLRPQAGSESKLEEILEGGLSTRLPRLRANGVF
jgi:predicted O-methyltransferase YrrM